MKNSFFTILLLISFIPVLWAEGTGSSAGLTLIEPASARSSSLGEAFVAGSDDIAAFAYNPASLDSLDMGQLSFSYQNRFDDESFGQLLLGVPRSKSALGLSVAYYDGGEIILNDGQSSRVVTAQRDLAVSFGFATTLKSVSYGITAKYLSSELGETVSGSALAMDLGIQKLVHSRLRLGAAIQNIGTDLKYSNEAETLPRVARVGLNWTAISGKIPLGLLLEVPYFLNEEKLSASMGLETSVSLLQVRAGYQTGNGMEGLSVGAGVLINQFKIDYAFGFADELDSQQQISISLKFGNSPNVPQSVKKPGDTTVTEINQPDLRFLNKPEKIIRVSEEKQGDK